MILLNSIQRDVVFTTRSMHMQINWKKKMDVYISIICKQTLFPQSIGKLVFLLTFYRSWVSIWFGHAPHTNANHSLSTSLIARYYSIKYQIIFHLLYKLNIHGVFCSLFSNSTIGLLPMYRVESLRIFIFNYIIFLLL